MDAAAGIDGVPSSQAARKDWQAVIEHSFGNNGGEVKSEQSAARTVYEKEGTSPLDADLRSITIEGVGELNNKILHQKLQEITKQREGLQQMEIDLRAKAIGRSDMLKVQNSFEVQLKEHRDMNANLKEKLHKREKHILELEMKLKESDRELDAMKFDTEAAWAKDDLLREQNKELATFRRERDNSAAEKAQLLNQIRDLHDHIQDKDSQILALQEQNRVAQETILFKDEQLRETQAWVSRVQEMDALRSSTNQSLQTELRQCIEQFNQYWIGFQRQFVEMEHHHMKTIQQLQQELAEVKEKNGMHKDGSCPTYENSTHSSSYNGNLINVKDGGKSNGHLEFTSNGGEDRSSSFVSAANLSTKIDHAPGVPVVPSSIVSMNAFIPPGQMTTMHTYAMTPQSVQQPVAVANSPFLQSHMGHLQSVPIVPTQQHWQNQQTVPDISEMPSQSKHPQSQTEQNLLRSDIHYSSNLPGEIQMVHPDYLNSHRDLQQMSGLSCNVSSEEVQVLESNSDQYSATQQTQGTSDAPSHLDFAKEFDPPEMKNEPRVKDLTAPGNQSQEQVLESGKQWPTSSIMLSTRQSSSSVSLNDTKEAAVTAALVSSILMPGKPPLEPNLLDERSLLACIVRAIPAGSDGRIRISTTLPNRLGRMLAPLRWHHYKKHYGKLDDFVAHHPELFVIEGDFIHLREGAQQIISATAAVAKVAAASASSVPYVSLFPSVAVTPVAQISRRKRVQSLESEVVNIKTFGDGASVIDAGDSSDDCTQILIRQDQKPNGVSFNIIQGLSDVKISSKLKNVQEANGILSDFKTGHSSVHFTVGNATNLDRTVYLLCRSNR
ncbi:uncharacterized protein LOC135623432 isoform X1 [Musa acuminata AAA Group]|uniref:uncharacterized protein LOC135623432 isoform X1 n=1 Tax=Musa acuminata AAA Group TaxID=214697 RepID=UPI0031E33D06